MGEWRLGAGENVRWRILLSSSSSFAITSIAVSSSSVVDVVVVVVVVSIDDDDIDDDSTSFVISVSLLFDSVTVGFGCVVTTGVLVSPFSSLLVVLLLLLFTAASGDVSVVNDAAFSSS